MAILGRAPDAWQDLPDPDAVFIGGTGKAVVELVQKAFQRLRPAGRIVTVVSSIDNLADVYRWLQPRVAKSSCPTRSDCPRLLPAGKNFCASSH